MEWQPGRGPGGDTLGREVKAGQGQVSCDQKGLIIKEFIRHVVHVVSCQVPHGGGEYATAPALKQPLPGPVASSLS